MTIYYNLIKSRQKQHGLKQLKGNKIKIKWYKNNTTHSLVREKWHPMGVVTQKHLL